jgi:YHS domain-containing protein
VRAIQRTQFGAKCAKNDLKPTDFVKRNFYYEIEGVTYYYSSKAVHFNEEPLSRNATKVTQ